MSELDKLREEVRSQVGTIALLDRARAEYKERIALLERQFKSVSAMNGEFAVRITELEAATKTTKSMKQRLAETIRGIAAKVEQL